MKIKYLLILALVMNLSSCSKRIDVDMILIANRIYTVDSLFTTAEAMAIHNGKIIAIGSKNEIIGTYNSKQTIDQGAKFIYPGFIDPHCHFLGYGQMLQNPWLGNINSWEEVVNKIVKSQNENPTSWVLGRGWNHTEWNTPKFPTKELLDIHFPHKPVYLARVDGHSAIVNSTLLQMAGITSKTHIKGGHIELENGEPTGLLIDNAMEKIRAMLPEYTTKEKVDQIITAQENCFKVGLTSVTDAGIVYRDLLLYDSLHRSGQLLMNINAMLEPSDKNIEEVIKKNLTFNPKLRASCIKLYADGALGSRGALMLEPYSDAPDNKGVQVYSDEFIAEICELANTYNYQMATHCIGDKAVRLMLNIYGKFLKEGNDRRWRIEHAQVVDPEDLNRFGALSIIPSIQTTHATSDMFWAKERLGERVKYAYAYQQLLQQNGWLPNGSDFPIEDINPLYGFYAGVTRKNQKGEPTNGFQMENALTREQALRAMTIWAAKADFTEKIRGSLEVGKQADIVLLDIDLIHANERDLFNGQVTATIIDGKLVYSTIDNDLDDVIELIETTRHIR
ncbi:MAG: amidohydrolase [Salinivirgaceae bacterium]|nr:amidohydrolase [Salinivirgaceae bacterium]MDY0279641.1 amidohydrolase [Salinivirgaceae bacterium]